MKREICPCCHYPTLGELNRWEICLLCHWEDNHIDTREPEVISGGPNGNYSLAEARKNFLHHYSMYRLDEASIQPTEEEIRLIKELIVLYKAIASYDQHSLTYKDIEKEIYSVEKRLHRISFPSR